MSVILAFENTLASETSYDEADTGAQLARNSGFFDALAGMVKLKDQFGLDVIDEARMQEIRDFLKDNEERIFLYKKQAQAADLGGYTVGQSVLLVESTELIGTILPGLLGVDKQSVV